jgi:hypothetical protein
MQALSHDRRKRYASVADLAHDINRYLAGRAVSAKDDSLVETLVKLIKRNKAVSFAAAAAILIVTLVTTISFRSVSAQRDRAVQAQEAQWQTSMQSAKRFAQQAVRPAEGDRLIEARRRAQDAEDVAPGGAWGHFARGSLAAIEHEVETARSELKQALASRGGDQPEIRAALANVDARAGVLSKADDLIADSATITDWRTLLASAQALYAAERYEDCKPLVERALSLAEAEKGAPHDRLNEMRNLLEWIPARLACRGFSGETKQLPVEERQQRVALKLREINGATIAIGFSNNNPDSRAMSANRGRETLRHIYALRGLELGRLNLYMCKVSDLSAPAGNAAHRSRPAKLPGEQSSSLDRYAAHPSECRSHSGQRLQPPTRHATYRVGPGRLKDRQPGSIRRYAPDHP